MKTFRMTIQLCPQCGYELDASTKVQGDKGGPVEGDVTVCIRCASVLQFGPELKLSVTTLDAMPADVRKTLETVISAINRMETRR